MSRMRIVLVIAMLAACTHGDAPPAPDAELVPCPGDNFYPLSTTIASCSVNDIRVGSAVPEKLWGVFPFDVEPSPLGAQFVVVPRVYTDPFESDIPGVFYTLNIGCGAGGALLNGCQFTPCVDVP
jgi:hypothetical protein